MGSAICSGWCIRGLELDLQYFHRIGCRGQQLPTEGGPTQWQYGNALEVWNWTCNIWEYDKSLGHVV